MNIRIRRIEARDETRWRELWDQYTRFYEREPQEAITRQTWTRIFDESSPIHAIVAEVQGSAPGSEREYVIGIANYIIHDTTSALTPVCYLQDMFVDPDNRAAGVGRSLIDWLIAEMERQAGHGSTGRRARTTTGRAGFTTNTRRIADSCDMLLIIPR